MTEQNPTFKPDWVSPPGETIADLLEELEWTQKDLARRLGYSHKHVNQLVSGKAPVSEDTALRLEKVLGSTASFWLAREARYRERLARSSDRKNLEQWTEWLDELPVKELMNAGQIEKRRNAGRNKADIVNSCLHFFGVASPQEWREQYGSMQVAFRRTREDQCDVGAITAWLRMGERLAEQIDTRPYDASRFKRSLREIRGLTRQPAEAIGSGMVDLCRQAGVAVVFVDHFPRTHVSGVARWLNRHRALIQLSLYGKWNDRMWFTFFHEAAHILLHSSDKSLVFLDDPNGGSASSKQEEEANEWAAGFLIPPNERKRLQYLAHADDIEAFAEELEIHPGIVVGRMQHEGLLEHRTTLNHLKARFRIARESD